MTSQEPRTPNCADSDNPDTEVIVVPSPAPVFVDSTGRRRRLLRRLSYAFGGLCLVYGGLVSVSLAGGPVSSRAVLPLPDLRDDDAEDTAGPRPAPIAIPSISTRPLEAAVADVAPRRRAAADVTRVAEPRPPAVRAKASPKPSPSPTPSSAKPVESTTVPSTPAPATSTPSTPTTVPDQPIKAPPEIKPPVPLAPLAIGGLSNGAEGNGAEGSSSEGSSSEGSSSEGSTEGGADEGDSDGAGSDFSSADDGGSAGAGSDFSGTSTEDGQTSAELVADPADEPAAQPSTEPADRADLSATDEQTA